MRERQLNRYMVFLCYCMYLSLLHVGNSFAVDSAITIDSPIDMQPVMDNEPPAAAAKSVDDTAKSGEQYLYESNLQHAVIAYGALKDMWPLKFPRQALAEKRVFDKNESEILTIHTRTLLSNYAAMYEYDFAEMYALWADAANLMDEAETAKLYIPPPDLANALGAWRMKKQIDKATLEAAWILGPSEVVVDANIAPIIVPAGFKFLHKADLFALENQIYAIKSTAITANKLKKILHKPADTISSLIAPIDDKLNPKWSASISVLNNRLVAFDGKFINDEMQNSAALIETIKNRQDPVGNMRFTPTEMGSYNKNLVRWLVTPKRDLTNDSMQYAITDGAATEALGIEYAFLKLGKNQQVAVTLNHLSVAQSLSRSNYLPEGKKQADYLPENVLNPVLKNLKPILQSINFKPGFQLKNATDVDKKLQVSLSSLIEGQPTIMEQGIKRMMAEDARKRNFWLFLKDRPRYQAMLFSALGMLLLALSKSYNAKAANSLTVRFPMLASFIVIALPIVMFGSLIYIHFILV